MSEPKVLIGLSTMEHMRRAEFIQYLLGLEKPNGHLLTTVHGQSPAEARNVIIKQALQYDCTHVFFMDDDMAFPPDTLMRLLKHDLDVVTGLYLMRSYPHFPCIFDEAFPDGKCKFAFLSPETKGVIPIVNCGLGAVLIKTEVFKAMKEPWVTLGEIDPTGWCDDVAFFNRVRKAGFKMFCDTDVRVGHMTVITMFPTQQGDTWYTEYKHPQGNVLLPQMAPTPPLAAV